MSQRRGALLECGSIQNNGLFLFRLAFIITLITVGLFYASPFPRKTYIFPDSVSIRPTHHADPSKFKNIVIISMMTGDALHFGFHDTRWPWQWNTEQDIKRKNQIISQNKEKYANEWGYEFRENHLIENEDAVLKFGRTTHPQWNKPWAIRQAFKEYNEAQKPLDYILWIDADAAFMNCSISLSQLIADLVNHHYFEMTGIQSTGDIIFAGDVTGLVNNGVFLMKNTQWTIDFVDQWIFTRENGHYDPWFKEFNRGDQSIFQSLLCGFKPYDLDIPALNKAFDKSKDNVCNDWNGIKEVMSNPERIPTEITERVIKVPRDVLNSFDFSEGRNRFIVHCTGGAKNHVPECMDFDTYISTTSNC